MPVVKFDDDIGFGIGQEFIRAELGDQVLVFVQFVGDVPGQF